MYLGEALKALMSEPKSAKWWENQKVFIFKDGYLKD